MIQDSSDGCRSSRPLPRRRPQARHNVRRRQPPRLRRASSRRRNRSGSHSEEYYDVKTTVFNALIDTIDLTQLAKLDSRRRARGDPRHRQRDHPGQERRHVDRRAGGAARGHLQRRSRLWTAGAAARPRRHRRHHGQWRGDNVHRGQRQDAAHQRAFCRQSAAHEHLPAHREPGRTPRRRIEPHMRRAPAGWLARQRHRPAARDRWTCSHHPQIQEGPADARAAGQIRLHHASRPRPSSTSSAACAATC